MRLVLVVVVLATVSSRVAHADGEAVNGFPNWQERVMHEWTNRARCDPQVEMAACGAGCSEGTCYTPQPPLPWMAALNHSARFHSDEMAAQSYFAHDSACTLVANIDALYPASCTGAASCACVGGTKTCSPTCTAWNARVGLFGGGAAGEIIASGQDPNGAFYQWLFESFNQTSCGYVQGPPTNGHRYNILMSGPAVGYGAGAGASVGDFGGSGTLGKIASGSHYPRSGATVDAWANWYDTAAPMSAVINVDGTCSSLQLGRGSVTNGAYHAALTGVGSGCHRYFFLFHDSGGTSITYPTTGSLGIGDASCADWDSSRPATGASCNCAPQCTGKQCGDDGCGGACGNCTATDSCSSAGVCIAPASDAGPPGGGNTGDAGTGTSGGGGCCETGGGGGLAAMGWFGALAIVLRRRRRT